MTAAGIPVTQATRRALSLDTGDFSVSELHFRPGLELAEHHHEHACIAMLTSGAVRKSFRSRSYELPSSSLATMPPGELHSDVFGDQGAGIVVIEIDQNVLDKKKALEPSMSILDGIVEHRSPRIAAFAGLLSKELRDPDELSGLAINGLVFELISALGRSDLQRRPAGASRPAWLSRTIDYLHDHDDRTIRIEDVATEVDLHPGYLARAFREHVGVPLATYARSIRIERAAAELATTDSRILDIAIAAGFSDQSHLTRLFRQRYGVTPAQFRAMGK